MMKIASWRNNIARISLQWLVMNYLNGQNHAHPTRTNRRPSGLTSYQISSTSTGQNIVYNWEMILRGSREHIINSVLPHEILHTVFASHFRTNLPRWLMKVRLPQKKIYVRNRLNTDLIKYLQTDRGIPFNIGDAGLPARCSSNSCSRTLSGIFLLAHADKKHFTSYVSLGLRKSWTESTKIHYSYNF